MNTFPSRRRLAPSPPCSVPALLAVVLALGACSSGGGSGDDTSPVTEPPGDTVPPFDTPPSTDTPSTEAPSEEAPPTVEAPPMVEESPTVEEPVDPSGRPVYATASGVEQCSTEDINARVAFDMRDYYIFADQVSNVDLAAFDDPDALIRALRVAPDVYSSVGDEVEVTQLLEEGETEGFGFRFAPNVDGTVRFLEVLGGSPSEEAGLVRGDRLIALEGIPVEELDDAAIRTANGAESLTLRVQTDVDAPRDVTVRRAEYRWNTVPVHTVFTSRSSGLRAGYLAVRVFLADTEADLDVALGDFAASGGIDDLIVDLRYNPGGFTRIAQRLAAQIAGEAVTGEVYQIARANERYSEFSDSSRFAAAPLSLGLSRVIVLATAETASASEALINGLQPYVEVVVIGERTDGKPFSSIPQGYCGKSINAMLFLNTNAAGVDVGGGIEPTCAVEDAWFVPAEDVRDPLLIAGLDYLSTGACPTPTFASRSGAAREAGPAMRATSPLQHEPLDLRGEAPTAPTGS